MRQDQWLNTVVVDGVPMGVWDTLSGGDVQSSETKYRPGGMGPERALGGVATTNNLTLGRLLDKEDWPVMKALLAARVGRAPSSVARQPLDEDGNPFGEPLVYTGVLQHVVPGDTDSNSEAAQVWQITVSTDAAVA